MLKIATFTILCLIANPLWADAAPLTFARDIRPILDAHCTDCHSGWFPKAGLRLDSVEHIREGGRSGPAIVPGEPDKGFLMHALRLTEGRLKMPPGDQRLSPQEVQRITDWIHQGAN